MSVTMYKMYIDGHWVAAVSGHTRKIINPSNQQLIAEVAEGDREDAKAAISAARHCFDSGVWSGQTGAARGALIYRLSELIERERETLAVLESLDTGKTVEESRWDMDDIAGIFRYYAGLADKDGGEVIDSPIADSTSRVIREPVGVCGQISPGTIPCCRPRGSWLRPWRQGVLSS